MWINFDVRCGSVSLISALSAFIIILGLITKRKNLLFFKQICVVRKRGISVCRLLYEIFNPAYMSSHKKNWTVTVPAKIMIFLIIGLLIIFIAFRNYKKGFYYFLFYKVCLVTNITVISVPGLPLLTLDVFMTLVFIVLFYKDEEVESWRCAIPV